MEIYPLIRTKVEFHPFIRKERYPLTNHWMKYTCIRCSQSLVVELVLYHAKPLSCVSSYTFEVGCIVFNLLKRPSSALQVTDLVTTVCRWELLEQSSMQNVLHEEVFSCA